MVKNQRHSIFHGSSEDRSSEESINSTSREIVPPAVSLPDGRQGRCPVGGTCRGLEEKELELFLLFLFLFLFLVAEVVGVDGGDVVRRREVESCCGGEG